MLTHANLCYVFPHINNVVFFFFLTISKVNMKLNNDVKFMKKKNLIHFIIKIVYFTSLKKLN